MLLMTDEFEEKLKKETMTLFVFGSHTHASKKNPISPTLAEAMAPSWFHQLDFRYINWILGTDSESVVKFLDAK